MIDHFISPILLLFFLLLLLPLLLLHTHGQHSSPFVEVMLSKTPVSSLAKISLSTSNVFLLTARRAYSHFPPTRRRYLLQQSRHNFPLTGRRSFSITPWRGFADVDESFDPRQQDRESDEVDVCIVGGGMPSTTLYL